MRNFLSTQSRCNPYSLYILKLERDIFFVYFLSSCLCTKNARHGFVYLAGNMTELLAGNLAFFESCKLDRPLGNSIDALTPEIQECEGLDCSELWWKFRKTIESERQPRQSL